MNRIKALREARKIKQVELAEKLGVTQSTLSHWETGKNEIGHGHLLYLADMFNVSIDYLLGREVKNPAAQIEKLATLDDDELKEVADIFSKLSPDNRAKLLEQAEFLSWKDAQGGQQSIPAPIVLPKSDVAKRAPAEVKTSILMAAYGGDSIVEVTDPELKKYIEKELSQTEWNEYEDDPN